MPLRLPCRLWLFVVLIGLGLAAHPVESAVAARPNILLITVDDMSCDSVGAFGCKLPDTTPNIDRLAARSLRFEHAHVQVGNCMPSRNVMYSGRYPHSNGVEGFRQVKVPGYPHLVDLMKAGGYFTAIRGKVNHSTPYSPYAWDLVLDTAQKKPHPKNIASYHESTRLGIAASRKAKKPFCLIVNISDPHKPFYGVGRGNREFKDPNKPTRVFTAKEVPVPGFLPDDPVIRRELAQYYSSVRRADDCVGAVLKALRESGAADETVVMFLSDHGMPLPFAKTQIYHHSTRTPWIVHWPGVTKANASDRQHMISAVDFLPTVLDIAGIDHPQGLEGQSFLPLLRGEEQTGRDYVFKEYNENSGRARQPMRGVQSRRFGYIFNPWSDGTRIVKTATTGTATYGRMRQLAASDPKIAARLDLFEHRVREEFYDYEKDPDALHNLIDDPRYQREVAAHRKVLLDWMERTKDHALAAFRTRADRDVAAYMAKMDEQSAAARRNRNKARRNQRPNRNNAKGGDNRIPAKPAKPLDLIKVQWPKSVAAGQPVTVRLDYSLPTELKQQAVHVTLKGGSEGKRIQREVVRVSGTGRTEVRFTIPTTVPGDKVRFAAFVGDAFQNNLQYLLSRPVPVQ